MEVAIKAREMGPGDVIVVLADCHSFPSDVKAWCDRTGREVSLQELEGEIEAEIRF